MEYEVEFEVERFFLNDYNSRWATLSVKTDDGASLDVDGRIYSIDIYHRQADGEVDANILYIEIDDISPQIIFSATGVYDLELGYIVSDVTYGRSELATGRTMAHAIARLAAKMRVI